MPYLMGLDPSLKKAGFVVLDSSKPDNVVEDRGLLKTQRSDGILVQRLIKQAGQIEAKIDQYNIPFVGMEAPFFGAYSTEELFALNQFIHRVFLEHGTYVVAIPPQMLKKLTYPEVSVDKIQKAHMIHRAKDVLGLHGKRLEEDVADAYWAGLFGKRFYRWHLEKTLSDSDLGEYEFEAFKGKHTYTRGRKKGVTEYKGIVYRENELFFDFDAIVRRSQNASQSNKKESRRTKGHSKKNVLGRR